MAMSMILWIFVGVGLAQRAAEDPEVVGVDEDRPALDRAPAGDDTVGVRLLAPPGRTRSPGAGAAARPRERALVEQQLDPLAGRQLALGVLGLGRPLAGAPPWPVHGSPAAQPPGHARPRAHPWSRPKRSWIDPTELHQENMQCDSAQSPAQFPGSHGQNAPAEQFTYQPGTATDCRGPTTDGQPVISRSRRCDGDITTEDSTGLLDVRRVGQRFRRSAAPPCSGSASGCPVGRRQLRDRSPQVTRQQ